MTLARLLLVMTATAALVVFGAQNWDNVPVQLIFGPPTRVRLIFLLFIAAGAGYVTALVRGFRRELRLRGELRALRRQLRAGEARELMVVDRDGEQLGAAPASEYTHERV